MQTKSSKRRGQRDYRLWNEKMEHAYKALILILKTFEELAIITDAMEEETFYKEPAVREALAAIHKLELVRGESLTVEEVKAWADNRSSELSAT